MVNCCYFQYKYVLVKHGKIVNWERGIDRIADLEMHEKKSKQKNKIEDRIHRNISLKDEWEILELRFSVLVPTNDYVGTNMYMDI